MTFQNVDILLLKLYTCCRLLSHVAWEVHLKLKLNTKCINVFPDHARNVIMLVSPGTKGGKRKTIW